MYIGTNLVEKSGVNTVMDKLDFTFAISEYSVPYTDSYGVDYSNAYNNELLIQKMTDVINKLGLSNIKLDSLEVDSIGRKIDMKITYNGKSLTKTVNVQ